MKPVHLVGLGMSPEDLTPRARKIIRQAQVLVGGRRLLNYFPDHPARKIPLGKDLDRALKELPALAATQQVVVLASGDPNFYGVGPRLVELLGADQVVIHPNITAVQAACARLRIAWQDAAVISLHGRSWEPLTAASPAGGTLIIYTDPEHTPAGIARVLLEQGRGEARLCVLEDLGQATEHLTRLTPPEAAGREFSPLNVVVAWLGSPHAAKGLPLHLGLPEEALAHSGGLITKAEVRAVALAKLQLYPGQVLWDVGAGCGSVGLEASLLLPGGRIVAVEQDPERAAQIAANRDKFGVAALMIVCGKAPECLAGLPVPQRVFVGGGGEDLGAILEYVIPHLGAEGRIVATAALLDTLETARRVLGRAGWEMEIIQLQVSRSRALAAGSYLLALNPVWIITGFKGHGSVS